MLAHSLYGRKGGWRTCKNAFSCKEVVSLSKSTSRLPSPSQWARKRGSSIDFAHPRRWLSEYSGLQLPNHHIFALCNIRTAVSHTLRSPFPMKMSCTAFQPVFVAPNTRTQRPAVARRQITCSAIRVTTRSIRDYRDTDDEPLHGIMESRWSGALSRPASCA